MLFDSIANAMGSVGVGTEGGNPITALLPLILMFAIFYFLLIRPQQKKNKQHKEMLADLRKGYRIITTGGIEGVVLDIDGDTLTVEIATGVSSKINRNYVAGLINPTRKADKDKEIK